MRTAFMRTLCAGVSLLSISVSVSAEDREGVYLGVEGGLTLSPSETVELPGRTPLFQDEKDAGGNLAAIIGYDKNRWRFEATTRWREVGFDTATVRTGTFPGAVPGDNLPLTGNLATLDLGLQAMYNVFSIDDVRVYLGGGLAAQYAEANEALVGGVQALDGGDWALAVHGTAQMVKPISDRVEFGLGYRVSVGDDMVLRSLGSAVDYNPVAHDFFAKLTWHFDRKTSRRKSEAEARPASAPAARPAPTARPDPAPQPIVRETTPAPTPAPQPEPPAPLPGPFQVFFDHNSSELTSRALRIINAAARAYLDGESVRILATGHTDTSGGTGYNQRLSERRAAAVRAALEAAGVSTGHISTSAVGETDPLVETEDGVREPQNRRVEIELSRN